MRSLFVACLALASSGTADRARGTATEISLRVLESAVRRVRLNSGRLPSEDEGLSVLIRRPRDWPQAVPWTQCLESEALPCDGWGNAYVYVLDANLPDGFGIYSCGEDGLTLANGNDLDDLNTWNKTRP